MARRRLTTKQKDDNFHKALLIATLQLFYTEGYRYQTAEAWACEASLPEDTTLRLLEELVSEGVVERTEEPTYCDECGADAGWQHYYGLKERPRCLDG